MRIDNATDVFLELVGYEKLASIVEFTLKEAKRQGDDKNFLFHSKAKNIFWTVHHPRCSKRQKRSLFAVFGKNDYGSSIFKKTTLVCLTTLIRASCVTYGLITKNPEEKDAKMINSPPYAVYGHLS